MQDLRSQAERAFREGRTAAVYLNKHAGLAQGKVAHAMQTLYGIQLSRGASAQVVLRAGQRL